MTASITPTISKKILNIVGRTNARYKLIQEGDRILLGLSGGKDSMLLATILAYMNSMRPSPLTLRQLRLIMAGVGNMSISSSIVSKTISPMSESAQIFIRF